MLEYGDMDNNKLKKIVFIDTEIEIKSKKVLDIGAVSDEGAEFHSGSLSEFTGFIRSFNYICGHNIIHQRSQSLRGHNPCGESGSIPLISTTASHK